MRTERNDIVWIANVKLRRSETFLTQKTVKNSDFYVNKYYEATQNFPLAKRLCNKTMLAKTPIVMRAETKLLLVSLSQ